jgi:hypothetical protein
MLYKRLLNLKLELVLKINDDYYLSFLSYLKNDK